METLMLGRTLSHYKILAEISRDGKGVVYRAVDVPQKREVALKVLSPELVSDPDRKHLFIREAQAVAALDHPCIVTVHEIDEAEGFTFIAMELFRGHSLLDVFKRARPGLIRSLELAIEVAEGLAHAHDQGILHRNLNPAKIMVDEEAHAKISDIGLANLFELLDGPSGEEETVPDEATESGQTADDIFYSSPEQIQGQEVRHQTDLYSFGIVLYEMLVGEVPFQGSTKAEVLRAILRDPAPRLPTLGFEVFSEAGTDLQRILDKCLANKPGDRYQGMKDLKADLQSSLRQLKSLAHKAPSKPADTQPAIAVLPFTEINPTEVPGYLGEGIAEELIYALSDIEGLRVAARASSFQFKETADDIGQIADALKVTMLLEGSVLTAGTRLQVTSQLTQVTVSDPIWSGGYEQETEDVFEIQDEIARGILEALQIKLAGGGKIGSKRRHSQTLEAYHLYLKGRHCWYNRAEGGLEDSIRFFKRAADEDPDYALAHVGLAEAYCVLGSYGFLPPKIAFAKAKAAVERALSLDDHLAEAHKVAGLIHFWWDRDWDGSEQRFMQSLDLEPTSAETHSGYALLMSYLGRREEAVAMSKRALELDPLSPHARAISGGVHLFAGDSETALAEYKKALESDPGSIDALFGSAICYSSGSMHDKAIAQYEKIMSLKQNASFFLGMLGAAYGLAGRREEAQAVVNELTDRLRREYVPPFAIANVWAGMNEPDHAFKWLEKSHQDRVGILWVMKTMRQWDPLRSDPRFEDILHRMNLDSPIK